MGLVVPFKRKLDISGKKPPIQSSFEQVAAFYTDASGHVEFVSAFWCQLTGCNQCEAMGEGWLKIVHQEDRENVDRSWYDSVQQEQLVSLEFGLSRAKVLRVILQALPNYDLEGSCVGYSGTLSHVRSTIGATPASDRPKELAPPNVVVSDRLERLRNAMDLAGLYYFEHDLVNGVSYRSKALRQLFGGNWTMQDLAAAIHPEDAPHFWENHNKAKAERSVCITEFRVKFPGCETMTVRSHALFSYNAAGEVIAVFGFTVPVTQWNEDFLATAAEQLMNLAPLVR